MSDVAARLGFKRGTGTPKKPKFEFQAALDQATESELAERRHLMKTVAARVYNQMGLSVRSHEIARAALLWFNQFKDTLPPDGDERAIADRLAARLGDIVEEFYRIRGEKVGLADELEKALTSTKRDIRLAAAKRGADAESVQRRKGPNSLLPDEANPEMAAPSIPVNPELVLQGIEREIKAAETAKKATKHPKKKAVRDEEKETL